MSLSIFLLLLVLAGAAAAVETEVEHLLNFKNGHHGDVFNQWDPSTLPDPKSCPSTWPGITCESGSIAGIALDRRGLSGQVNFSTLVGLGSLQSLTLFGNSFTGQLDPAIATTLRLQFLDISLNGFSGEVPSNFLASVFLISINISHNNLSGPLNFLPSLDYNPSTESLDLSYNSLRGLLSSHIENLANLKVLNLSHNHFFGKLPLQLSQLTHLEYLDFSHNKFKGSLPDNLPPSLISFDVSGNGFNFWEFFGNLPQETSQLVSHIPRDVKNAILIGWIVLGFVVFVIVIVLRVLPLIQNGTGGDAPPEQPEVEIGEVRLDELPPAQPEGEVGVAGGDELPLAQPEGEGGVDLSLRQPDVEIRVV